MKKYLSTLAVVALAASAFAQGTVNFANSSSSLVTANGTPIPANGGFAQLIWAPAGTPAPSAYAQGNPADWFTANSAWHAVTDGIDAIGPAAGRFAGNTVTIPAATPGPGIAAGAGIQAIVAGWTGNFADLNAAFAGNASIGFSAPFTMASTGNPTTVPPGTAATMSGAFTGGLNALPVGGVIPEPSTLALAGLGVAALLVLRRRS